MKHAISSIFKAAMGARNAADDVPSDAVSRVSSLSMVELNVDQLRFVVGGDYVEPDGLPKGGWKAPTSSTTS